ncbi:hypothetical protein MRX96_031432 [Rhipicephalus microplus]
MAAKRMKTSSKWHVARVRSPTFYSIQGARALLAACYGLASIGHVARLRWLLQADPHRTARAERRANDAGTVSRLYGRISPQHVRGTFTKHSAHRCGGLCRKASHVATQRT